MSQKVPQGPGRSPKCPQPHASLSPSPGYYYDLDDSCDDSDEEEVRAHLRCVAEQPPLKLDTSSEVLVASPGGAAPPLHQFPVLNTATTIPTCLQRHQGVRDGGDDDGDGDG